MILLLCLSFLLRLTNQYIEKMFASILEAGSSVQNMLLSGFQTDLIRAVSARLTLYG